MSEFLSVKFRGAGLHNNFDFYECDNNNRVLFFGINTAKRRSPKFNLWHELQAIQKEVERRKEKEGADTVVCIECKLCKYDITDDEVGTLVRWFLFNEISIEELHLFRNKISDDGMKAL